ncbi:hypothetical protein QFZ75_000179 [Streptomyces sp. V3I8]|uniref:hypothetical protein n=1 Tax=Streptomyces sp. V3I8 TaxID=3042279 RepID=UPI00278320F0|nr:hypothetical protein [Streptomyces sp. V3I8]MDQ1033763.1 hypothetical protein [Streptomyces sp. V3I8]
MRRLRAEGRYGPRFRDVLPGFAGVVVAVCAVVAGLAVGYRAAGSAVPAGGVVVVAFVIAFEIRRRRPGARRRRGRYTADELRELDVQGLALAVARMLRRDGWRVRLLPAPDRPRLYARDAAGRQLDVVFRPVAEPLPDEDLPGPRPHRDTAGPRRRLVVHRGAFRERDVRWAQRQADTGLLDGPALERWAGGARLHDLLAPDLWDDTPAD